MSNNISDIRALIAKNGDLREEQIQTVENYLLQLKDWNWDRDKEIFWWLKDEAILLHIAKQDTLESFTTITEEVEEKTYFYVKTSKSEETVYTDNIASYVIQKLESPDSLYELMRMKHRLTKVMLIWEQLISLRTPFSDNGFSSFLAFINSSLDLFQKDAYSQEKNVKQLFGYIKRLESVLDIDSLKDEQFFNFFVTSSGLALYLREQISYSQWFQHLFERYQQRHDPQQESRLTQVLANGNIHLLIEPGRIEEELNLDYAKVATGFGYPYNHYFPSDTYLHKVSSSFIKSKIAANILFDQFARTEGYIYHFTEWGSSNILLSLIRDEELLLKLSFLSFETKPEEDYPKVLFYTILKELISRQLNKPQPNTELYKLLAIYWGDLKPDVRQLVQENQYFSSEKAVDRAFFIRALSEQAQQVNFIKFQALNIISKGIYCSLLSQENVASFLQHLFQVFSKEESLFEHVILRSFDFRPSRFEEDSSLQKYYQYDIKLGAIDRLVQTSSNLLPFFKKFCQKRPPVKAKNLLFRYLAASIKNQQQLKEILTSNIPLSHNEKGLLARQVDNEQLISELILSGHFQDIHKNYKIDLLKKIQDKKLLKQLIKESKDPVFQEHAKSIYKQKLGILGMFYK